MVDMADLCETLRNVAATIKIFPLADIRFNATKVDHYAIADGDAKHGFIALTIRLRGGRRRTAS